MLDQYAMWIGYGVMGVGGLAVLCLLLIIAIGGVNTLGNELWRKLRALYDLGVLRRHVLALQAQGKIKGRQETEDA